MKNHLITGIFNLKLEYRNAIDLHMYNYIYLCRIIRWSKNKDIYIHYDMD